ncbi:hypothetical protein L6252_00480 [Candidatus Parcubacteria bacterium]|nr:hypothetical protein [Candidatus Parcubacteria bacterium]
MYIEKPEDGIKIEILEGNLYFGWVFREIQKINAPESVNFYLHIHFTPPTNKKIVEIILRQMKSFFPLPYVNGYPLKRILSETYQEHGDYGCINGLPFAFDSKNPSIQKMIQGIERDCDELKNRLKKFLQEIFVQKG